MNKVLDIAIKAIDDEPEYPDAMPEEMQEALHKAMDEKDLGVLVFMLRQSVMRTKDGIRKRLLDAMEMPEVKHIPLQRNPVVPKRKGLYFIE